MSAHRDPLYSIFEQHLFNILVENETTDEFLDQVVREYMALLSQQGKIPPTQKAHVEGDLREEVLEMLRKKTYGYYNVSEYRQARLQQVPPSNLPQKKKTLLADKASKTKKPRGRRLT